jgi:O-antigen/teichoic acid export membrane protein
VNDRPTTQVPLRRSFAWMFTGNLVFAVTQWAMLAGLAKMTSAETVGKFNVGLAITAPIALFFNFGLRSLQATDARDQFPFSVYATLRLLSSVAAVVISCGVALTSQPASDTRLVIELLALSKAFAALSDVAYGLFQKYEQMEYVARSMIGRGVLSLLALLVAVWATGDLVLGCAASAAANLLVLLAVDLPGARRLEPVGVSWRPAALWTLLVTSLPLGTVTMLMNLNTNVPVYFLQALQGEEAVGYFAAINYIGYSGNTVVGAVAQTTAPRLARLHVAQKGAAFRSILHRTLAIGAAIGAAGVAVPLLGGEPLLTLLYNAEYARYADVFTVLMLGYGLGYAATFVGVSLTAKRNLRTMVVINVLTIVLNVAACWFLIPSWGLIGAAWARVLSQAVKLAANYAAAMLLR